VGAPLGSDAVGLTMQDWLGRLASELGTTPPSDGEIEQLLALAGAAAHASERTAAPISCFLVARAGIAIDEALTIAERLASALEGEPLAGNEPTFPVTVTDGGRLGDR